MASRISTEVLRNMTIEYAIFAARSGMDSVHIGGVVYVIARNDEYWQCYKIGQTKNLVKRLSELQREYNLDLFPIAIIWTDDPKFLEQQLHKLFSDQRATWLPGREWYSLNTAQVGWFQSLQAVDTEWVRHLYREHKRVTQNDI